MCGDALRVARMGVARRFSDLVQFAQKDLCNFVQSNDCNNPEIDVLLIQKER